MINIEFKQTKGSNVFVGATERGSTIAYKFIPEDRLVRLVEEKAVETETKEKGGIWEKAKQPTKMRLDCNFKVETEMLDLIQKSKIVEVIGRINNEDAGIYEVTFLPRPHFEYEKLQDVIVDLCEKFNL